MRHLIYMFITALIASGCSTFTSFRGPATVITNEILRDTVCYDTTGTNTISWRELFGDTCLIRLIETGLHNNADLQSARLAITEAEASLAASRQAFLPSLSIEAQGNIISYDADKAVKSYTIGTSAEWETDISGSLRNAKKAAHASFEASRAYEQFVRTGLIASIAESYYSLIALDKKLEITKETVNSWEETLKTMKSLKNAGQQTEAAVSQSESSLLEIRVSAIMLEKQIHELENSLSVLIGIPAQPIERSNVFEIILSKDISRGISLETLSRRPDIKQAEWQLAEAFYGTNKARSAFYPNLTLGGTAGWTNNSAQGIINPGRWLLEAIGSLIQPVFNRGINKANLKTAKARQEKAIVNFSQKLVEAGAEVNDALTQLQTARQAIELDTQRTAALESAVASTYKLMIYGNTNYLEVITARQSLLSSRLNEISDRFEEMQSLIKLYRAAGGN
ncbi:MAG: TolC family protein [Prevotella sp.]